MFKNLPSGQFMAISIHGTSKKIIVFLTLVIFNLFAVNSLHSQYVLKDFKPKIKSSPHTAKHIVQDDGKLVMLGDYSFVGDTPSPNLLRFNPDGSVDKQFNLSTELLNQFATDFEQCCARANVIQGPNGDLVLLQEKSSRRVTIIDETGKFKKDIATPLGYFQFEKLIRHKNGYIAIVHEFGMRQSVFRFDQNGNIDPTFTRIDFIGYVEDMIVDPNENVIIVGDLTIAGTKRNLVKINESGVLDGTFGNEEIEVSFAEIDLFPDGKIVVSSGSNIVMLNPNGNKVSSFLPETNGNRIYSSVVDPINNRIIIVLEQYPLPVKVVALETNGEISDFFAPISLGSASNALARISRFGQNFVLTTGNEISYENSNHSFLTFNAKGDVNKHVSTKEKLFSVGLVNAGVELEDGSIIIAGSFSHIGNTEVNNIAKLDKLGNVNSEFSANNPLSIADRVEEIKKSNGNVLYLGGVFKDIVGVGFNSVIRINENGQLDVPFANNSKTAQSHSYLDDFIIMPDRIIASGFFFENVIAFDLDGNRINTFNSNMFGSTSVSVPSLYKVDEDNFAVGGYVLNEQGFLWIMDIDGNIDNSYVRHDEIPISPDHLIKIGNEIYLSGTILNGQSSSDATFVYKYNFETGKLDSTVFSTMSFGQNRHLLPLNDSMVVISGKFDQFNNSEAHNFVVSDFNGKKMERMTFDISNGIGGHYLTKTVKLADEKILLLGQFHKINEDPFYSAAIINYTNYKPVVLVNESYSVAEDSSFYLSDLVEIIDLDDEVIFVPQLYDNFNLAESGLVNLKKDYNGSFEFQFQVKDSFTVGEPFSTVLEVRPVNDIPLITKQLKVPQILPGATYEIGFDILQADDVDGDALNLIIHEGENYSIVGGTTIQSNEGFNGTLKVGVSVSDGLLTSEVFNVSIESVDPTGVEEASNFAVYPNPISAFINVTSWENIKHLSIFSIAGQKIAEFNNNDLKERSGHIEAGMFPKGMLLLTVVLRTNELKYVKLIKK